MVLIKWIAKLIGGSLVLFIVYIGGVILLGNIFDYQPNEIEEISKQTATPSTTDTTKSFSLLNWNIGYCGLGAEMDFFYDGGNKVKTPANLVNKYSKGITDFLRSNDTIDFILLQEVDKSAARSSFLNELELIEASLPDFISEFAINYKSFFVPVPIFNPMGKVTSGIVSLSKNIPIISVRHNYHSSYPWPKKLFMLDRCFLVNKYQLPNGKDLVIINTHNSAFDAGGKLREIEMLQIRDYMLEEFSHGNYVIAGGDWNQNPPGFKPENFGEKYIGHKIISMNETLFPKQWEFAFGSVYPTNRNLDIAWDIQKTKTTIIDFFIVSPNIIIESIQTVNLNFDFSDHEPIILKFRID